jgi:hypothetical protein
LANLLDQSTPVSAHCRLWVTIHHERAFSIADTLELKDLNLKLLVQSLAYVILIAAVAQFIWRLWLSQKARSWPSVLGKVSVARIIRGIRNVSTADDSSISRTEEEEYFAVEVRYEYKVRGRAYVGTSYSIRSPEFARYDEAIDALEGISAGREVRVYYDPQKPQRAVLKTAY